MALPADQTPVCVFFFLLFIYLSEHVFVLFCLVCFVVSFCFIKLCFICVCGAYMRAARRACVCVRVDFYFVALSRDISGQ